MKRVPRLTSNLMRILFFVAIAAIFFATAPWTLASCTAYGTTCPPIVAVVIIGSWFLLACLSLNKAWYEFKRNVRRTPDMLRREAEMYKYRQRCAQRTADNMKTRANLLECELAERMQAVLGTDATLEKPTRRKRQVAKDTTTISDSSGVIDAARADFASRETVPA